MKYFVVFILFLISSCDATNSTSCQITNSTLKTVGVYCENYTAEVPLLCLNESFAVEPHLGVELKVGGCDVKHLRNVINRFRNYSQILDISYSAYSFRDLLLLDLKFKELKIYSLKLEKFNASHNNLEGIPFNFLNESLDLTDIDLSHNMLGAIHGRSFGKHVNLTTINLSHNFLILIDQDAFMDSPKLKFIDLSFNRLTVIPHFISNERLESIHLEENPLYDFDCYHIWEKPIPIYISWKYVATFNGEVDGGCKGRQLPLIRNSGVEGILPPLDRESIRYQIHCNEQSFRDLNIFRAGPSTFDNITDIISCFGSQIWRVDLSGNLVGKLQPTTFQNISSLKYLSLRGTWLLDFDFDAIKNQESLFGLDISDNNLKYVKNAEFLQKFPLLFDLKAGGNQINNSIEVIKYLKNPLQTLDLSGSRVGQLDSYIFEHLTTLTALNFSDTSLEIYEKNPFELLQNLQSLDISRNNLTNVKFVRLSATLNRLKFFYAANCDIVDDIIQYFGSSLEELNLSGNSIGMLNDQIFEGLTNLKYLKLSNANIRIFDCTLLRKQMNFELLDLSYNQLDDINFRCLPSKLVRLNLEENDLGYLPQNFTQANFPKLKTLGIARNMLRCTDLKRISRDWSGLEFIGNRWDQKPENCEIGIILQLLPFFILNDTQNLSEVVLGFPESISQSLIPM